MKNSTVTLFNKNSINITRYDKPNDNKIVYYKEDKVDLNGSGHYSFNKHNYWPTTEEKEIIKKSNLGFYYKSKVRVHKGTTNQITYTKTPPLYRTYTFCGSTFTYVIKYPYSYNNVSISPDTRPYDLLDKRGIEDHYIKDLKDILEEIFTICRKDNIKYKEESSIFSSSSKIYPCDIGEFRCKIYEDLFGDKNGISVRTDKEKIEAHGFDNKESFRKDKQS